MVPRQSTPMGRPSGCRTSLPGGPHNDDDIAGAIKTELMLDIQVGENGNITSYGFVLDSPVPSPSRRTALCLRILGRACGLMSSSSKSRSQRSGVSSG